MIKNNELYKKHSKKTFDKKSNNYDETFDGKYCERLYPIIVKRLKKYPFKKLLDVGCGTGTLLSMVLRQYKNVEISGIDISKEMINKAKDLLENKAELLTGDSENLPWEDNSFDIIICNASFHHFPQPIKTLQEMGRVLNKKGRLIILDAWLPNPFRFLFNVFFQTPFNKTGDVKMYSEKEMCKMLKDCGFDNINWEADNKFSIVSAEVSK